MLILTGELIVSNSKIFTSPSQIERKKKRITCLLLKATLKIIIAIKWTERLNTINLPVTVYTCTVIIQSRNSHRIPVMLDAFKKFGINRRLY